MANTDIKGWIAAAKSRNPVAWRYFRSRTRTRAKIAAKAERLRGFKYWSMRYRAVPATGRVNKAAISATPAQRDRSSAKHLPLNSQQASKNRKTEARCQRKSALSKFRWLSRTEVAIRLGNKVEWAWGSKNWVLKGNSSG